VGLIVGSGVLITLLSTFDIWAAGTRSCVNLPP
jgi:hypothetical protein